MIRRSILALVVAVCVILPATAAAEPVPQVIEVPVPITLKADTGEEMRVPPGYYVPAPLWTAIDDEMKRLETTETRLTAENKSLRASADEGPGWGTVLTVVGAIAAGIAAGAYAL